MKIGMVCPYNITLSGGVQECIKNLQTELIQRGHSVKIITPRPRKYDGYKADDILFIGSAKDIKSPFHTTAQVSASTNIGEIEATLKGETFDILHFHEPWVPFLSRQILAQSHCPNIATFHAKLPETVMNRTIERVITPYTRSILKNFEVLTAVSDSAADYVHSLTPRPIEIVPNPIDLSKYRAHALGQTRNPPKILYIGRLENRKGLKYLLQAHHQLVTKHPNVQLIVAGDGPERKKLEKLASLLKLKSVVFAGYVSDEEKRRLLNASDLFCSPALYGESFGIVLLEAMASGLVIVAGANAGYADVLQQRGAVSLVNPKDTLSFSRRLELLLYDEELCKLWRLWALHYVQQFDVKPVADQYEKLYRQIAPKATS